MAKEIIATVKLAPGNIGWYDELTGIHITLTRPTAYVYSGSNTTNLINGLKLGKITIQSGSLIISDSITIKQQSIVTKPISLEPTPDEQITIDLIDDNNTTEEKETKEKPKRKRKQK